MKGIAKRSFPCAKQLKMNKLYRTEYNGMKTNIINWFNLGCQLNSFSSYLRTTQTAILSPDWIVIAIVNFFLA